MLFPALSLAVLASQTVAPTQFNRVFTKGEKSEYKVHSVMNSEMREVGLGTWIPNDLDLIYNFTYEVTEMKADGICVMRYKRPSMTQIDGETVDAPPKKTVEKINFDLLLTVSPINEILDMKDMAPKKPEKKPNLRDLRVVDDFGVPLQQSPITPYIQEIYRLALFAGSLDSSLDFAPSLPYDEVKPGATWKKTVGFSPQKLKDKSGKFAVQRLDFDYVYKGKVTVNGKPFERIEGKLSLKTDLASYIHQVFEVTPEQTGLKEIPLQFSAAIEFDLDPKTHRTIRAIGRSQGGFQVLVNGLNVAAQEERFKSTTTLSVVSHKS